MTTRLAALLSTLALAAALAVGVPPAGADDDPRPVSVRGDGHGEHPETELVGQFPLPRLKAREVHLSIDRWGYRFQGGGVANDLTITAVGGGLRYVDRAARRWKKLPSTCRRVAVPRGVGAQCAIPRTFRGQRMFLEVWPRLGGDRVDGSSLPATYRMWVLVDAGDDRVAMGAGADFANGAFDDDTISGGGGADWIRAGVGTNRVSGGAGDDEIAGGDQRDTISGGDGRDEVFGGPGDDVLAGDAGADAIGGGPGRDVAYRDSSDRVFDCEDVRS